MMRVVVAAVEPDCPAHRALRAEGVVHEERVCAGDLGYSELLTEVWNEGRGFILLEHDVIPWPGALRAMWDCPEDWCAYGYPMELGSMGGAFGCMKFGERLMRDFPLAPDYWKGTTWESLDGHVCPLLAHALGARQGVHVVSHHEHLPPVAHARRLGDAQCQQQ